jgi:hypothetical protein
MHAIKSANIYIESHLGKVKEFGKKIVFSILGVETMYQVRNRPYLHCKKTRLRQPKTIDKIKNTVEIILDISNFFLNFAWVEVAAMRWRKRHPKIENSYCLFSEFATSAI